MIKLYEGGAYVLGGKTIVEDSNDALARVKEMTGIDTNKNEAKKGTIAYPILEAHNESDEEENLKMKFDSLTSHDITYVGIIQTARASGMKKFPMPYVLTNCHNTLCAVGGTINEDDHKFALSAAKRYGGIYVPPHMAVIHTYNREMMAGCGKMILGSDSHTRYGALGTIAVGEGGGELVKQLVGSTYDVKRPETVAIYLTGKPSDYIGPHDVALQIIGKVFKNGYVKNKVMEFIGDGISNLSVEFRNGIDVMTTETTCWSSIWRTDEKVKEYFEIHGRPEAYEELNPSKVAYYDGVVYVDLAEIKPSIAIPFHPSNVYTIEEFKKNKVEILKGIEEEAKRMYGDRAKLDLLSKVVDGEFQVDQGVIAGCSGGTFDNVVAAADILDGKSTGNGKFALSVYPGSQPEYKELLDNGTMGKLMDAGAVIRSAFCGPCFGAGDTPANNEFSIRHTTRNFPNREGSKPSDGQISAVALMDAKSIAATAANGGILTGADEIEVAYSNPGYKFNSQIYERRNYNGTEDFDESKDLTFGPNIKDWPEMETLKKHLLLRVASYITDEVTTTDELIPSGETSSFRSNPHRLAEFTLSRTDPDYVGKAKEVRDASDKLMAGDYSEIAGIIEKINEVEGDVKAEEVSLGSTIFAKKPGDGSAREHAASCQKVLGAWANIANEYATKRYRSNLINWGMVPFILDGEPEFEKGDYIFVPDAREAVLAGMKNIKSYVIGETVKAMELKLDDLTDDEKKIIAEGSLINYHRNN
ncbi:aconitate hydratase [Dethiosulfatibacter aminovorans DSM 17477]|uniref:Aconitate hydratase n=1 Tax=Dethiosulfatibacter aminovorans DSM 17477 TaxID=1121476 RepID=A0A1M6GPR5_9FIRM|nr:hydratase [Dethiosulfatibacter aminovorans]SHJ11908.1 aconitate hydratase [Dethiosulfatibacter aminovorans DSM 17477]